MMLLLHDVDGAIHSLLLHTVPLSWVCCNVLATRTPPAVQFSSLVSVDDPSSYFFIVC